MLPVLHDIATVERPEDRHCYMTLKFANALTIPSWLVSDGTLRLTALTLPACIRDQGGVYLIEEPENGIHPAAYDSPSSVYGTQILLATHSPAIRNKARVDAVSCFTRENCGATDVVLGSEHPTLRDSQRSTDLGTLLASRVLG